MAAQSGVQKGILLFLMGMSWIIHCFFKKNWSIEISSVGLPKLIELNYLKDSVPVTSKDRL